MTNSYSELRSDAVWNIEQAKHKMAVALALRDGELSEDEAVGYLVLTDELSRVQSDYYPGDEYYDQAVRNLERGL